MFQAFNVILITEVTYVYCGKIGSLYRQLLLLPSFCLCIFMSMCLNHLCAMVVCNMRI